MEISSKLVVVSVVLVLFFIEKATAATIKVGGEQGWQESTDFGKWASSQKFTPGDELDFEYSTLHSVVEVPNEEGYKNCDISTPLNSWTGGQNKITLNTTGTRYFVCGTPGHCESGMKVKITTVAATQSSSSSTATPTATHSTSTSASSAKAQFFGFFAFLVASSSAVVLIIS